MKTDNNILTYQGTSIRSAVIDGETYYSPIDIYRCLGVSRTHMAAPRLLRDVPSVLPTKGPFRGTRPPLVNAETILDVLPHRVRGSNKMVLKAFLEWFVENAPQSETERQAELAVTKPVLMADIAHLLDPDTRAEIRKAFIAMQRLAEKMSAMADARMALTADLTSKKG